MSLSLRETEHEGFLLRDNESNLQVVDQISCESSKQKRLNICSKKSLQTESEKQITLEKAKHNNKRIISVETDDQRQSRLEKNRLCKRQKLSEETESENKYKQEGIFERI